MCKYCNIENESFSEAFMELKPDIKAYLFKDTEGDLEMILSSTFTDNMVNIKACPICGEASRKE